MNVHGWICRFSLALSIGCLSGLASGQQGGETLYLQGVAHSSKNVSGYRGSTFIVEADTYDYAMYGISSTERNNHPCLLWIGLESIYNATHDDGAMKNLCGKDVTSRTMKAAYRDNMRYGARVFVRGIRVCTNRSESRVKGFQLRAVQIVQTADNEREEPDTDTNSGTYTYTPVVIERLVSGKRKPILTPEQVNNPRKRWVDDPVAPADFRNNCQRWHAWAECPLPDQVATGVVAHFEPGKEPRSLTGIGLRCQTVKTRTSGGGARAPL